MSTKTVLRATAEEGRRGEVRDTGSLSNDLQAVEKWIARLRKAHGKDVILRACYEARPCGFGLAKRAFADQDVKLRSEFKVGVNAPRDLGSILDRAKAVRDASQDKANAAALKDKGGWIADDTTALDTAIGTVSQIDKDQLASISVEIAGTDARNAAANEFFDSLLTIQNAANIEWTERKDDNRAMRESFRLGLFPPASKKAKENGQATPNGALQEAGAAK